jgi:hypothetical protein
MVFNLVFIAAVVNLARDWMSARRSAAEEDRGGPPDPDV